MHVTKGEQEITTTDECCSSKPTKRSCLNAM